MRLKLPRPAAPEAFRATSRVVLAGMGGVYASAFASLGVQVRGLAGAVGIEPNAEFFARLAAHPQAGFFDAPSLCWWLGCSDPWLVALCAVGFASALFLAAGVAPLPAAVVCWVSYLSLFHAARGFLGFQWDTLLLEAGFLTILLAPPRVWRPSRSSWSRAPSRTALFLFRWLLFRLVFTSGWVKLAGGDPTWRDLSALTFHYETQPLPIWTSWYAHQLPEILHRLSTFGTLLIEICVPFLYFAPRRARLVAAAITTGLMVVIAVTGNYGFFNLLAVVLCLSLLDDRALPATVRRGLVRDPGMEGESARSAAWPAFAVAPAAAFLVCVSLAPWVATFTGIGQWPAPVASVLRAQDDFHLVGSYGLFARMTTERPEILVEGSRDGETWRTYAFEWKPGDPEAAPRFAGPHMPRLDWRMWFAALGDLGRNRWIAAFARRLLEGSPPVLALLADDPFPDGPPRYVRATVWDYRFTRTSDLSAANRWWDRTRVRSYVGPLELAPDAPLGVRLANGFDDGDATR